jgi:hypothetical protein
VRLLSFRPGSERQREHLHTDGYSGGSSSGDTEPPEVGAVP